MKKNLLFILILFISIACSDCSISSKEVFEIPKTKPIEKFPEPKDQVIWLDSQDEYEEFSMRVFFGHIKFDTLKKELTLAGLISDSSNADEIPMANIAAVGKRDVNQSNFYIIDGTVSDISGKFYHIFKNFSNEITVRISCVGYKSIILSLNDLIRIKNIQHVPD